MNRPSLEALQDCKGVDFALLVLHDRANPVVAHATGQIEVNILYDTFSTLFILTF